MYSYKLHIIISSNNGLRLDSAVETVDSLQDFVVDVCCDVDRLALVAVWWCGQRTLPVDQQTLLL